MAKAQTANVPSTNTQANQFTRFRDDLKQRMPYVAKLLPAHIKADKFEVMVLTALQNNPKLMECTVPSLLVAVREAAELGLSFAKARKECDIIPRWSSRDSVLEAQFQPRYGGLMTLAIRSGEVRSISSTAVREGDHFIYERGLNPILEHKPILNNPGKVIAGYCVWTLKDDTKEFEVVEMEDIERAMKASQSRDKQGNLYGPWKDDFEEQVRKTAIRRASKYMPSSAEDFQRAVTIDTLRDIGHEVKFEGGDVVDITEQSGPVNASEASKSQLNQLEAKIQQPLGDMKAPEKEKVPAGKHETTQAKPAQTGSAAPAKTNPPAQTEKKNDGPPINVIQMVKDGDGKSDYAAWVAACIADLQRAPDQAWRDKWRARHAMLIEGGEYTAPDEMEPLIKALG